jgi:hypothetical protein
MSYFSHYPGGPFGPIWLEQCDAARRIREHFGTDRALAYIVGQKFLGTVMRDGVDAAMIRDFAAEVRTIFLPTELREYFRKARMRKHPGKPTDDLRYSPDQTPAVEMLKQLLL